MEIPINSTNASQNQGQLLILKVYRPFWVLFGPVLLNLFKKGGMPGLKILQPPRRQLERNDRQVINLRRDNSPEWTRSYRVHHRLTCLQPRRHPGYPATASDW